MTGVQTCALPISEENEQVIAAALTEFPQARTVPIASRIREMMDECTINPNALERLAGSCTNEGYLRLLPGTLRTDGFFVCVLELSAR